MPIPTWSDFKSWKGFFSTVTPFAFLMGAYGGSREGQGFLDSLLLGTCLGLIFAAITASIGGIIYGTLYLLRRKG